MDAAQWSQQMASNLQRPMEEVTSSPTTPNTNPNIPTNSRGVTQQQALERRTRPQKDQNLGCPRCHSTNTKFCYYNNYSLTQPRYFCKTCRRYWTQGGSLRSVPVGGGSRKNKRSSSSSSILTSPPPPPQSTTTSLPSIMHNKLMIPDLNPPISLSHLLTSSQNPNIKFLEGHDLNLAFPMQSLFHHHVDHQLPKIEGNNNPNENHEPPINLNPNNMPTNNSISTKTTTTTPTSTTFSALELLRTGIASRGNLSPFAHMPMPGSSTLYQSGYPNMQEFKTSMNMFSSPSDHNTMDGSNDHHNHHHHHHHHHNESKNNDDNNIVQSGARLLFPFADMNKLATNTQQQHHDDHIDENDQSNKGNGNDDHHHHDLNHHHSGYWSGMLGGGAW